MLNIYDSKRIGNRLKETRKALKLSQEYVAEKCNCVRQSYAKWENGNLDSLSLADLQHLCNLFECDIGYLLCEYDTKRHVVADIHTQTGLSEIAIVNLISYNGITTDVLSKFLALPKFAIMLDSVYHLAEFSLTNSIIKTAETHAKSEGNQDLFTNAVIASTSTEQTRNAQEYMISTLFSSILSDVVKAISDSDKNTQTIATKMAENKLKMANDTLADLDS